jgi:PKD repeat protein
VAGPGDVDRDGVPDVIVGADGADPGGVSGAGSAYVRSGADGSLLHRFDGTAEFDCLGWEVAGAGDVDGDGWIDLITAGWRNPYVHSGADGGLIYEFEPAEWSRPPVAGPGDLNGDGHADLLVGDPHVGANAYSGADGALLYEFEAPGWTSFGEAVAGTGDVNGDGVPDIIIGGDGAWAYSGADASLIYQLAPEAVGDRFGRSVSGAGDVDGDGVPDFIIGAPEAMPRGIWDAGSAYVYSGADGTLLFRFDGTTPRHELGCSVASAGDVNLDGRDDVIIGAYSGSVYVISLGSAATHANFSASPTSGGAPLAVDFTNTSTGDYTDSLWRFGDGVTSTLDSPSHMYTAIGIYTVTLKIDGLGTTDTMTRSNYITACHCTDVICDCKIDIADIQAVAGHWHCEPGGCYEPKFDINSDGRVDVVDIMMVAARWGCECGDDCYAAGPLEAAALLPTWALAEAQPATVSIEPVTSTVQSGDTFTVSVVISDAVNLGAFQFDMHYDPTAVHAEGAAMGPFLGSTGRNVGPVGPTIDNDGGTLSFGAFSFGTQAGPQGRGVLAEITLTAKGVGTSPLDLQAVQVLNPAAEAQPVTVSHGTAVVKGKLYLPLVVRVD